MICIWGKNFLRGINIKSSRVGKSIKSEIAKIKHDSEEHLQAINESTNEIAANYEYTCEIERKLDKLSERVDQLQIFLETGFNMPSSNRAEFDVKRLNRREQEVFLVIYTLEEEKGSLTYLDIANRLDISEQLAGNYVTSLIEKGVPIIKRYINCRPYFRLDPVFKTLQAKENILQLSLQEFGF